MKTEVSSLADCKREVSIEVPVDEVNREFEKVTGEYARYASVPGFRPGKTPKSVVKTRYKDSIRNEVMQHLLSHGLSHAVKDHNLRVIGNPSFDNLTAEEGKALSVKATVEVIPDFNLTEYKDLEITKRVPTITDADIDSELKALQEKNAELVPAEDRPAQDGDYITVDLKGKFLSTEEQDLTANDVEVIIGAPNVQTEFSDNLRGAKVGEEKVFKVKYPEDFSSKDLAGKELEYTAQVTALRAKELPEIDDEFAKGLGGEIEGLEDLRKRIREDLEVAAERHASSVMRDELLDKLVKLNPFEVPPTLIEQQTRSRVESLIRDLVYQRVYRPDTDINLENIREEARNLAISDVRGALILERIAELEKTEVTNDEIDHEIQHLADRNGQTFEAMKSRLTKEEALDNIRDNLKNRKALDVVVAHAKITTEAVTHEAANEAEETVTESVAEQG
ncbi:MAG TPA: trigger factor [Blastocatellia bacterium]|nr:trigger factor [Blastocatellia bacterium]